MVKVIIFDWGGVLAPSDNEVASRSLARKYNRSPVELKLELKIYDDKFCERPNDDEFLFGLTNKLKIPKEDIMRALNEPTPNEVFTLAKSLKSKSLRIYLLSNQMRFRSDYIRNHYDLSFFDKVFFSNEIGLKKPLKNIFEFVLKEINQKPNECLFIDDNIENVEAAKKKGLNSILFKNIDQLRRELDSYGIKVIRARDDGGK